MFYETQSTIVEWCKKIFNDIHLKDVRTTRFKEEVAELLLDVETGRMHPAEFADVYITLVTLAEAYGVNLHAEVDVKMAGNRRVEWVAKPNGGRVVRKGKEYIPDRTIPIVEVQSHALRHTCIKDDGGTPGRRCQACEYEQAQERKRHPMMVMEAYPRAPW